MAQAFPPPVVLKQETQHTHYQPRGRLCIRGYDDKERHPVTEILFFRLISPILQCLFSAREALPPPGALTKCP